MVVAAQPPRHNAKSLRLLRRSLSCESRILWLPPPTEARDPPPPARCRRQGSRLAFCSCCPGGGEPSS
eukprot:4571728-Pyramimonas_sp.AAC.1